MTTVAGTPVDPPILRLLAVCSQIDEWADTLRSSRPERLTVAHGAGRRSQAIRLADTFGSACTDMTGLGDLAASPRDLVLVVDAGRPQAVAHSPAHLRRLLHAGTLVWSITGPRPNLVADFCHDVLAVPVRESGLLLRCHQLIVERLVAGYQLATGRTHEASERT